MVGVVVPVGIEILPGPADDAHHIDIWSMAIRKVVNQRHAKRIYAMDHHCRIPGEYSCPRAFFVLHSVSPSSVVMRLSPKSNIDPN